MGDGVNMINVIICVYENLMLKTMCVTNISIKSGKRLW